MSNQLRLALFFVGATGLAALLAVAFCNLPGPEALRSRYLEAINGRTTPQRRTLDAVTAVNFDFRAVNTLGEEFILFASVMGSLVLLRQAEDKEKPLLSDAISRSRDVPGGDAIRLWTMAMIPPKLVFGIYIVTHGQISPGGGFQGGVILASVALIVYLGEDFRVFRKIVLHPLVETCEAIGAAAFVLIGLVALVFGLPMLTNYLPLGTIHTLTSGGTIALISIATGLEVTAGFVLLLYGFLQETLVQHEDQ